VLEGGSARLGGESGGKKYVFPRHRETRLRADNATSVVEVAYLQGRQIMTVSGVSSSVNAYPSTSEPNAKAVRPGQDLQAEKLLKPQEPRPEILLKPKDPRPEILLKPQDQRPEILLKPQFFGRDSGSQDGSVGKAVNTKA
jgi:hypothetical protein